MVIEGSDRAADDDDANNTAGDRVTLTGGAAGEYERSERKARETEEGKRASGVSGRIRTARWPLG